MPLAHVMVAKKADDDDAGADQVFGPASALRCRSASFASAMAAARWRGPIVAEPFLFLAPLAERAWSQQPWPNPAPTTSPFFLGSAADEKLMDADPPARPD